MKENVGKIDRIVRSVVGTSLVGAALTQLQERPLFAVLGAVAGALVLESALTRVCPMNAALGIDTRTAAERLADGEGSSRKPLIIRRPVASA